MRIGIDGRILTTRRGMGRVLRYILRPLLQLGATDEFLLYIGPSPIEELTDAPNIRVRPLSSGLVPLYEQILLPAAVKADKPDVLWCPANTGPVRLRTPVVLTLHDLIFRHRGTLLPHSPSAYQRFGAQYTDWCASKLARRAAHVVTDSAYSAAEIHDLLGVPRESITVVPLGVTIAATGDSVGNDQIAQLGIDRPFFLLLGATDPRKNTPFTVDVFLESAAARETQLVVAGLDRAEAEAYRARTQNHVNSHALVFLDFVDDEMLAGLYRHCLAFVFPSLFEGFGLPVLEAMHFGAPVLASNLTCVPEIGGDAVLYFNPRSREELSDELLRLLGDPVLRTRLREAGKLRAASYDWRTGAETLMKTLRGAAR